jgi:hypothetical protein
VFRAVALVHEVPIFADARRESLSPGPGLVSGRVRPHIWEDKRGSGTAMHAIARHRAQIGLFTGLMLAVAGTTAVQAQERPGRFVMSPVDGGFARLDTETGTVSICKAQPKDTATPGTWNCQPMGDAAAEAQARLKSLEGENKELRAEVKRMEDLLGLNGAKPKGEEQQTEQRPGGRSGGLNLPSEEEIDKALTYMERMVKKFHDAMKRLEGGDTRKGMPL